MMTHLLVRFEYTPEISVHKLTGKLVAMSVISHTQLMRACTSSSIGRNCTSSSIWRHNTAKAHQPGVTTLID